MIHFERIDTPVERAVAGRELARLALEGGRTWDDREVAPLLEAIREYDRRQPEREA